jgi:hypothetical protein
MGNKHRKKQKEKNYSEIGQQTSAETCKMGKKEKKITMRTYRKLEKKRETNLDWPWETHSGKENKTG